MKADHLENAKRELLKAGFYELEPVDFTSQSGLSLTSSPEYLTAEGGISRKVFKGLDILEGAFDGVWGSDSIFEADLETAFELLFNAIFVWQPLMKRAEKEYVERVTRQVLPFLAPLPANEAENNAALCVMYYSEYMGKVPISVIQYTDHTQLRMTKLRHMTHSGFSYKPLTPAPDSINYIEDEIRLYETPLFIREALDDEDYMRLAMETDALHYLGLLHTTGDEAATWQTRMWAFGNLAAYLGERETFDFRRGHF